MSEFVAVNSVIEWHAHDSADATMERVLWLGPEGHVVTISLTEEKPLPVWRTLEEIEQALKSGDAIKRTVDPLQRTASPDAEYLKKHKNRLESSWRVIETLVQAEPDIYFEDRRGSMINDVVEELGIHKMTVYKYLRKYWKGGMTKYALLPDYHLSGGPGKERVVTEETTKRGRPSRKQRLDAEQAGVNVTDDIRRIFTVATHRFYDNRTKTPLRRAYALMVGKYFNIGYREESGVQIPVLPDASEYPTFGQYKYWFTKEFNLKKTLTARMGETGMALRHRAVLGESTHMARGPGSLFQIDATIGDVYLVSSYDRSRIIGRPVIYVVIDVFSRVIVGFHVGLEGPSWAEAMLAIENTTRNKQKLCEEYGITITEEEWPASHLPEEILADRGEMLSKASDQLLSALGIVVSNTPPYRADWKGIVEQTFRIANLEVIHWLPGAIQARFRKRGEPDNRLDATLDLQEFTKILIKLILKHNQLNYMLWYPRDEEMIREHVEPVPNLLWKWGISHKGGHLRQMPADVVRLQLLPRDNATVTFRGIRFRGMYYSCESAIREQWFERARMHGTWKITASYDPRLTDIIYAHLDEYGTMEPCLLLEREERYKGHRLEDVLELQEMGKVSGDTFQGAKLQGTVTLEAEVKHIVQEAMKKTKAAHPESKSKRERTAYIRQNRKEEAELIRQNRLQQSLGDLYESKTNEQSKDSNASSSVHAQVQQEKDYVDSRSRDLELLKKLRENVKRDEDGRP